MRNLTVRALIAQLQQLPPRARVMIESAPVSVGSTISSPLLEVGVSHAGRDGAGKYPPEGRVSVVLYPAADLCAE